MKLLLDQNLPIALARALAAARASSPSVVVLHRYVLDLRQLEADLQAALVFIDAMVATDGHAVFSMGPNRPTRAQRLPLVSEVN